MSTPVFVASSVLSSAGGSSGYEVFRLSRAGFYDYRLVSISLERGVQVLKKGRLLCQPPVQNEMVHQVWVDVDSALWNERSNLLTKTSTFDDLEKRVPIFKRMGVTCLVLHGAMDRQSFNPSSPTDRAFPSRKAGGPEGFRKLVDCIHAHGMKVVVESTMRVSTHQLHRKYQGLVCHTNDEFGRKVPHFAHDGRETEFHESLLLNFRKAQSWDLMVNDIREWVTRYQVDGVHLDSCHTLPVILEPDTRELFRRDSDGVAHYSQLDILQGEVVVSTRQCKRTFGYWGTKACVSYPNPLLLKICCALWNECPNFLVMGDCDWQRERSEIISGVIPMTRDFSRCLGSILLASLSPGETPASAIRKFFSESKQRIPRNCQLLAHSCDVFGYYPQLRYGQGVAAFVDMLFMLPPTSVTFSGEFEGWNWTIDQSSGNRSFPQHTGVNKQLLEAHYRKRATLRHTYAPLNRGKLRILNSQLHFKETHAVLTFARSLEEEGLLCLCAINISPHEQFFYFDLGQRNDDLLPPGRVFEISEVINGTTPMDFMSSDEILNEAHLYQLSPYSSMCLYCRAKTKGSPVAERVLYESSFQRLEAMQRSGTVDPRNNLVYQEIVGSVDSLNIFVEIIQSIIRKLPPSIDISRIADVIQKALYHHCKDNPDQEAEVVEVLQRCGEILDAGSMEQKLIKRVLSNNELGPVVFVTPEIAPWSTIGGVGVMVDELTQQLAKLVPEVYVISPYYDYDRYGNTGYLEKDGVKWKQNIVTTVGSDRIEVGLHEGKMNGVTYWFLHHYHFFPAPYHTGSPVHQLQTIALLAKASLETLCQLRIRPSVICTNDWPSGLLPAYARTRHFGSFFDESCVFHVIHNLETGYQGLIYPEHGDGDLGWVHHLPTDIVYDSYQKCIDPSRAALATCDQWGTVSKSYRNDLLEGSSYQYLLRRCPKPFAHSNGIRVARRRQILKSIAKDHDEAKKILQEKYFGKSDLTVPVLSFVGRIVQQKGVLLILNAVEEIMSRNPKVMVLIGGMANKNDKYGQQCVWKMQALMRIYQGRFWCDPERFFSDGGLVNLGSDFGLMPSLFEPSGVVQQEYFAAGTPCIAFLTGGLKDTVFEYDRQTKRGNGFIFMGHAHHDFVLCVQRALDVFHDKDEYLQVRKNAFESVLDNEVVARAWGREFARLRRKMWVELPQEEDEAQESVRQVVPMQFSSEGSSSTASSSADADLLEDSGSSSSSPSPATPAAERDTIAKVTPNK